MSASARIPLIVFGDGPRLHSGLGRIAGDLMLRLYAEEEELGIQVYQVGVDHPTGWHWQSWPFFGFQPTTKDYGRGAVQWVVQELKTQAGVDPIIFANTDPARAYDLTRLRLEGDEMEDIDTERVWGYFPIDGHNPQETIGGPAAQCVKECERVLAYGRYGAGVLHRTLRQFKTLAIKQERTVVPYLPHGIDTRTFCPRSLLEADVAFRDWRAKLQPGAYVLGCVATNQPRKDLGLLFASAAELRMMGIRVAIWLQTDRLTHAWDIGELAHQFAFRKDAVLVGTEEITDQQLAARYTTSDVTFAPGLGEGFGYPIVESLACGTPVVHGNYGGGVELIPREAWLVSPSGWRIESIYALLRPVFSPKDVAKVLDRAWIDSKDSSMAAFCRGSVAHLDWQYLWPRWRVWFKKGLTSGTSRAHEPVQPMEEGEQRDARVPAEGL